MRIQGVDESIYQSYLFLAIKLSGDTYSRTGTRQYYTGSQQTLRHARHFSFSSTEGALTFAIINRRPSQRDKGP